MTEPVSTLFLDIGGVLLTNGWDRKARLLAADTFGLDYEEMNERHHLTFDTYEVGKLTLDEYLERVVFHEPRQITPNEFREFMLEQSRPLSGMIDLICGLKSLHQLKVAVVSNEGRELTEYRIRTFGLGRFIDFFVVSCYVHFRKPDKDMYRIALDMAQVAPEQVLYIEDRPMFVEVAASLGIRGIVHRDHDTTRRELAALGLTLTA
jgi:putative hydrolase of the HAD superfamily